MLLLTLIILAIALPYNFFLAQCAHVAAQLFEPSRAMAIAVTVRHITPTSVDELQDNKHQGDYIVGSAAEEQHSMDSQDSFQQNAAYIYNELTECQTFKGKMFRAARLRKLQATAELREAKEEVKYLLRTITKKKEVQRRMQLNASAVASVDQYDLPRAYSVYDRDLSSLTTTVVTKKVAETRNRAEQLRHHLRYVSAEEDQEEYLVFAFIADVMPAYLRPLLVEVMRNVEQLRALFVGPVHPWMIFFERYKPLLCGALLVSHIVITGYFAASLGSGLGNGSVALWSSTVLLSLFLALGPLDLLGVLSVRVLLLRLAVQPAYFALWDALRRRARLVLLRSRGVMKRSRMLVQHFNAACRVARSNPHWPVARMLLSVNDVDIEPGPLTPRISLAVRVAQTLMWPVAGLALVLPFPVLALLVHLLLLTSLCGSSVGLYMLYMQDSNVFWWVVGVGCALQVTVGVREIYIYWQPRLHSQHYEGGADRPPDDLLQQRVLELRIKRKAAEIRSPPAMRRPPLQLTVRSSPHDQLTGPERWGLQVSLVGAVTSGPPIGAIDDDSPMNAELAERYLHVARAFEKTQEGGEGVDRLIASEDLGEGEGDILDAHITLHFPSGSSRPQSALKGESLFLSSPSPTHHQRTGGQGGKRRGTGPEGKAGE
ncbi:hypothetical protein EON64_15375, partial [archaeon]